MILPDFSSCRLLVVGDVMLDAYVWGEVERISPEAPIPVVRVRERSYRLGGAANVAANVAGLGCAVRLLGVVGADGAARRMRNLLRDAAIEDDCVVCPGLPTVTKTRIMGGRQQVVRLDEEAPGPIDSSSRKEILARLVRGLDGVQAVILSDYGKGVLDGELLGSCIDQCRKRGVPVFVDPKRLDWTAYAGAFCVTPNRKEFERVCRVLGLTGDNLEEKAAFVRKRFDLQSLLVTLGPQGMVFFNETGVGCAVPSQAREVFDVSGAGDTVIAVLASARAAGCPMTDAVRLANCAAGLVVARVGTCAVDRESLQWALQEERAAEGPCPLEEAISRVEQWRLLGRTVVFTNGCFDLLHPGHVSLLRRAAALGDKLVVALNTDHSIRRIKGSGRPILGEKDRAAMVAALDCVDLVVLFDQDTPLDLLKALRPDVLVKGGDYAPETVVGADLVKSWGGRVEILPLVPGVSTSRIVETIRGGRTHAA
jgi:D-beta-D-heptose 7-phosphate kinase/D-beta-D-heptose 1-phosphate adenosyltransferase